MWLLLLLAIPALAAALLTLALSRFRHGRLIAGISGPALSVTMFWLAWLSSPTTRQEGDSDAEMYLGRSWEPRFVVLLLVIGLIGWGFGDARWNPRRSIAS